MSTAPRIPSILPRHFRLGAWTVDVLAGQIQRGSETVRLEPKVMSVLKHLAMHAGEVVTRDALLDAVWPDVVVTENALSRCISDLRRALGEDPRAPMLIETIPKTGYRLLVPAEPLSPSAPLPPTGDGLPAHPTLTTPTPESVSASVSRPRPRWIGGVALVALLIAALVWVRLGTVEAPMPNVTALQPVTSQPGSEGLSALSPSGDRIAYVRFGERGVMGYIETVGTDGGTPLRLTEGGNDAFPTFSPDGQHIAFLRCPDQCQPYRISALGTDERPLADLKAHPAGLDWSPDGRVLAFVEPDNDAALRIAVLDLETGERRRLTTPPTTSLGDLFPTFSPDGQHLAFVRRTDATNGDIYTVPLAGGTPHAVSSDRSQIARLTWFPDGRTILAASDRDGTFRLWRFSTTGAPPEPLTIGTTSPVGPTLSASGDRLVVESWDLPIQLWRYDLTTSEAQRSAVVPSTRWDRMPALSPDARRAVFVSTRTGHAELWTADLDGSTPRRLTHLEGPAVRSPQWSPDGHQIAFLVRTNGQSDVYTMPAAGGVPQRLTATEADEVHLRWMPDSGSLLVGRRSAEQWNGVRLDLRKRTETILVPGAVALAPALDGRTLWFVREHMAGLWSIPLDNQGLIPEDASPVLRVPDLAADDAALWSVTDDGLLYIRRTGDDQSLVRWMDGRAEVLLAGPLWLDGWAPALAASTDGSTVLLAQLERPEIDILLAELGTP